MLYLCIPFKFKSANIMKLPVVSDLRQADIILGGLFSITKSIKVKLFLGHGAPIMPAVEDIIHKPEENTAYLNIGRLNITTIAAFKLDY